jgi:hypothetical protein
VELNCSSARGVGEQTPSYELELVAVVALDVKRPRIGDCLFS